MIGQKKKTLITAIVVFSGHCREGVPGIDDGRPKPVDDDGGQKEGE